MEPDQPKRPPVPARRNVRKPIEKEKPVYNLLVINKINRILNQKVVEYNNQLVEYSNDFSSEEELVQANDYLLKYLIKDFKQLTGIEDDNFLADFVDQLKAKAYEILQNFLIEFRKRPTAQVTQEQDEIYDDVQDGIYENESIYEAVNELQIEDSSEQYQNKPDDSLSTVSSDCGILDRNLSADYLNYIKLYRSSLKNSIEYPIDENAIKQKHRELRSEFMNRFAQNEMGSDVHLFGQYLDQCFNDFKFKLSEEQRKVQNIMNEGKRIYTQGMEDNLREGAFYSEQKLIEIHNHLKSESINRMKQSVEINFKHKDNELEEWTQELIRYLEDYFNVYHQTNELAMFKFEKELDSKIKEYCEGYENEINNLIESVESKQQLNDENERLILKLIKKFQGENISNEPDIMVSHLLKLKKAFKKSFEKAEDLLEYILEKKLMVRQKKVTIIREEYKHKMQLKFEIKKFYFKSNFNEMSKLILDEIATKNNLTSSFVENSVDDILYEFEALNARNTPKVPAIGIDLGTTNSCVAYFTPDLKLTKSTVVMPNELSKDVTPSVVSFRTNNEIVVGDVAKEEQGISSIHIHNTIHSVKRLIGQSFDDLKKNRENNRFLDNLEYELIEQGNKPIISVRVDGMQKHYFPEEISAKVLQKMKNISETYLEGFNVKKVVITVPAYFNESQKEATKQAGVLAGLEVLGIINEPTAAAIAFKVDRSIDLKDKTILIFDFGGGTLDVAIVRLEKANIITKAKRGDNYLGGEDIDNNLINYCINIFLNRLGLYLDRKQLDIHRLRRYCQEAKIRLSSTNSTNISIKSFYQTHDLNVELSRTTFNEINKSIFDKAINLVKETMKEAKVKDKEVDDIVLVGGSTRIPRIQQMLSKLFDNRALNHTINPDLSVAVGAAIHAATLNGQSTQDKLFQFTDVTPMSYGVEKSNKEMFVLIPRNTKLPTKMTKEFDTHESNQQSVQIRVYEGDDKIARNNHLLGDFTLFGIPPGKKGKVIVNVTFEIKEDGILRVSAKCDKIVGNLEIKEHKSRLTEEQLQQLFEKSKFEKLTEIEEKPDPDHLEFRGNFETFKKVIRQPSKLFVKEKQVKSFDLKE